MERLDDTDERILAELAEDARATFAEIGERVNLSAPAVKRRVDRMLDNGVIRGFTTVVDRNALGWTTEAYVQDRKSTRLNSSHMSISYAVFCLKKKKIGDTGQIRH